MTRQTLISLSALTLLCGLACQPKGSIQGYVVEPTPAPAQEPEEPEEPAYEPPEETTEPAPEQTIPPPRYEEIEFTWERTADGPSGDIQTTFPDGESYKGQYHQITQQSTIATLESFFDAWYEDPWSEPRQAQDWPHFESLDPFITHYGGRVVAVLESERGLRMRCNFRLDDPNEGMEGGGWGECQVSNGDRITAIFKD